LEVEGWLSHGPDLTHTGNRDAKDGEESQDGRDEDADRRRNAKEQPTPRSHSLTEDIKRAVV